MLNTSVTFTAIGKHVYALDIFPLKKAGILGAPSMHLIASKLFTGYFNRSMLSYIAETDLNDAYFIIKA